MAGRCRCTRGTAVPGIVFELIATYSAEERLGELQIGSEQAALRRVGSDR